MEAYDVNGMLDFFEKETNLDQKIVIKEGNSAPYYKSFDKLKQELKEDEEKQKHWRKPPPACATSSIWVTANLGAGMDLIQRPPYSIASKRKQKTSKNNNLKLRMTMEKNWFEDLARSYVVVAYNNNHEKKPAGSGYDSEDLSLEGALNLKLGKHKVLRASGKVSFWENSYHNQGTDYSLRMV